MTNKELIINLLDKKMSEEIFVYTKEGKKRIKYVCSTESEIDEPRYFTEILLED